MKTANLNASSVAPHEIFPASTTRATIVASMKKHSDLVSSVALWSLNTLVLASKAAPSFPELIGRCAQVMLSYVGAISIPAQARYLNKTEHDLHDATGDKDKVGMLTMTVKVAQQGSDILLTAGGLLAAITAIIGLKRFTQILYAIGRPWGLASLTATVLLEVYEYYSGGSLLERLNKLKQQPDGDERIRSLYSTMADAKVVSVEEGPQRGAVIRLIDVNTWETLRPELRQAAQGTDSAERIRLFSLMEKGISNKREFTQANLGLLALGYIATAICRANPDTLLQSAVIWGMSSLYTSKTALEKYCQAKLSREIHQAN